MKKKTRTRTSILTLAAAALFTGCGRDTRSDSTSSEARRNGAPEAREGGSAEQGGTHTGNTGQGPSHDASSRPISGMSGSPTGSPLSSDSPQKK